MNKEEYESMKRIVKDGMINITKDGIVHMSMETLNRYRSYKHNLDMGINYLKENASYEGGAFCDDLSYYECEELLEKLEGKEEEEEEEEENEQ